MRIAGGDHLVANIAVDDDLARFAMGDLVGVESAIGAADPKNVRRPVLGEMGQEVRVRT